MTTALTPYTVPPQAKVAMLDNLSEIEVAYNLLKSEGDEDKDADPIDKHYRKLNTKIDVVDKKSEEFSMIKKYVSNTHASTHGHYKLVVEEVSFCLSVAVCLSDKEADMYIFFFKSQISFDIEVLKFVIINLINVIHDTCCSQRRLLYIYLYFVSTPEIL